MLSLLVLLTASLPGATPERRVLVYTKNGKGYVHDNLAASSAAIRCSARAASPWMSR